MQVLDKDEICLEKVRLDSMMKLRLRAESAGVIGNLEEGRENCWRFFILVEKDQCAKIIF